MDSLDLTMSHDFRVTFKLLDDDALIDAPEFSELCKITVGALHTRNYRGELPPASPRSGRHLRWRAGDVRTWMRGDSTIAVQVPSTQEGIEAATSAMNVTAGVKGATTSATPHRSGRPRTPHAGGSTSARGVKR